MTEVPNELRNLLTKFEESLNIVIQQLSEDLPVNGITSFEKDVFWKNFCGATKLISHEASKFCMLFSKQPLPSCDECKAIVDKLESTCLSLITVFFTFPKVKGKTIHKEICFYVLSILQAVKSLCVEAKIQSSRQLHTVGNVWEKCEAVENLPKDNKEAILRICAEQHDMVQDAIQEITDAMEESENFEIPATQNDIAPSRAWVDTERNVILPCTGLMKAVKGCLKKIRCAISERGSLDDSHLIAELDNVAEVVKNSSSLVDDLALNLYPPMNHSAIRHQASVIRNHFKELLANVGQYHFCSTEDTSWVDFLNKAIDHNWVRINDMLLTD